MKKRIIVILIIAAIAGILCTTILHRQTDTKSGENQLRIYGTVEIRDVTLAFPEQELVSALLVDEGDQVQEGQILARQQTDKLEASIAEAEAGIGAQQEQLRRLENGNRPQEIDQAAAEVTAARTQLENGRRQYNRLKNTARKGAATEQALDEAASSLAALQAALTVKEKTFSLLQEGPRQEDIAAARFQLASLQANLRLLNIRLKEMTLTAPCAGIIESRLLEPGEMAGPQRAVLVLAKTEPKWVRAYLSEPDLGHVRPGMAAAVFSDSFPDTPFTGTVGFISPTAEFTPRAVQTEELRTSLVYELRITVPDPENRLRLGMPVTVQLDREETTETIPE